MGYTVGSMKNVKIFVLYLMQNLRRPLDFVTLNEIMMQTDYIMYLDFAEAFHKMLDDELIACVGQENDSDVYDITERGRMVAESLHSDILSSILDKSLAAALRYLDFKKRGIEAKCEILHRADGRYDCTCRLLERGEQIFTTTLAVDSADRAGRLRDHFLERPEDIYRGFHALLAGNMNFLFDD